MTRCQNYFSIFGHLRQFQFVQRQAKITKIGSKFCQILNTPSKNFPKTCKILPKWLNFVKSDHTVCNVLISNGKEDVQNLVQMKVSTFTEMTLFNVDIDAFRESEAPCK